MKANPNKLMLMIGGDLGRIAAHDLARLYPDDPQQAARDTHPSYTPEVVPMTEDAYADYCRRHAVRPCHPTLAAYPYPRG